MRTQTDRTARRDGDEFQILSDYGSASAALIDRLIHHCHIVNIRGNSYQMRHHGDLWSQNHLSDGGSAAAPRPEAKGRKKMRVNA